MRRFVFKVSGIPKELHNFVEVVEDLFFQCNFKVDGEFEQFARFRLSFR